MTYINGKNANRLQLENAPTKPAPSAGSGQALSKVEGNQEGCAQQANPEQGRSAGD
jgi:hypothetical protein